MKTVMPGGMSVGLQLIALGIGYLVYAQANKEAKALKTLGKLIGLGIIAVSIALIAGKIILFCGYSKMCPLKGMMVEKGKMEQQAPVQKQ